MKLRKVLLDCNFITALLDEQAPAHTAAKQLYATLVDNYQVGTDRLYALSTVLRDLPREFRQSALAPVLTIRVTRQYRVAASRIDAAPEVATSLVMLQRERIRAIATTTHDYDAIDVEVLSALDGDGGHPTFDPASAADIDVVARDANESDDVSSRTALQPARQSTGE